MSEWTLVNSSAIHRKVETYAQAADHMQAVNWLLNSDVGKALAPLVRATLHARAAHDPASFEVFWHRGDPIEIRYWLERTDG